jgi:hypothetical protein
VFDTFGPKDLLVLSLELPSQRTAPRRQTKSTLLSDEGDKESTWTPRNIHKWPREIPYRELIMRGAFVVQFRKPAQDPAVPMEGSVEEVDTARSLRFHSEAELIGFLRQRSAEIRWDVPGRDRP